MNYYTYAGLPISDESRTSINKKIEALISKVLKEYKITREELLSKARNANLNEARSILMYIIHKIYRLTQEKTGSLFNRNHCTVRHLSIKVAGFIEFDKEYERKVSMIVNSVV